MHSPTHFLVGALICRSVRYRPVGLVLALGSHFALDALPHFEDPSILPPSVAVAVGHVWPAIMVGLQLLMVPAIIWVWVRYGRGFPAGPPERFAQWRLRLDRRRARFALYLISGGILAALPDAIIELTGRGTFLWWLNMEAHDPWQRIYFPIILRQPQYRPLVAAVCMAVEWLVTGLAIWALARRGRGEHGSIGA